MNGATVKTRQILRGRLRKDRKTKNLVRRLRAGEIALVAHQDMDWVAAESLLRSGVKAVLNTRPFSTGVIPPGALQILLEKGIHLVENVAESLFEAVREGEIVDIVQGDVYCGGRRVARGNVVTGAHYRHLYREAARSGPAVVDKFVKNTLDYAYRERRLVTGKLVLPPLRTGFKNRDAVVVIRGKGYRQDLRAIRAFIREKKPVLVGVDGGGDALLEHGLRPDLIIGDMDSVSDAALARAGVVVVHAYADGRGVPGRERLERLGIPYRVFAAPGTSEDVAMLIAYEAGAALIVAIGTHSSVVEFLEKGRAGMSSTFLVRLKVGDRLVDAKGVSRLYSSRSAGRLLPLVVAAGLMPLLVLLLFSPLVQHLFRLLLIRLRLSF